MLGGREANVLGGRLPIKDQFHRKVREAQERFCGLLGRGSLLYKNLLYAFFFLSSEKHRGCGIFNRDSKMGEEAEHGSVWGSKKRRTAVSLLGWQVVYLHPLRVPEIINMHRHSCFSSRDFIQSLQKLRIKCHGFVLRKAELPPNEGALHTAQGM